MKKALKLLVALVFSLTVALSSMSLSLAAPGGFTVKATVAPTSVTLSWSASSGADKYIIQHYKARWYNVAEVNSSKTSHTITGLKTGASYKYRVCAVDTDTSRNNKTYSKELSVVPAVGKTTGLKAAPYNYNTIKLSWTKQSGVSGYQIYQYNSKTKKYVKVKTVSSKYNYAYIKSLKNGSTYKFKVRAYLKGSKTLYGSYSSVVSAKVAVPTPTVKASTTYNTAKLSWSKVKDADGYRIYKYDSAKKKWVTAVKSTTKTSYTFKDLKTGTTYSYRVKAYQKTSKGTYWSAYKTVKATPTLAKPTSFKEGISSLSSLTFSWGKVSGATGYKVYRYNFDTKKWETLKNTKTASYTDTNLKAATQYSYRVKAFKKVSGGYTYSPVSSTFRTSTESVNSMGNISVISKSQNSITLSWDDISADGYEIYNAANGKLLMTVSETTKTITNLNPGVTYKFKIRAYFTEGSEKVYTAYSKTVSATTLEKEEEPDKPSTPTVPSKVSGLQKVSATETSISVKWNASTNATGYILSYKAKSASSWTECSVNTTSYNITGLTAGTQYEIKVTAVNGSTSGTASDVLSVSTVNAPVTPSVPSKVSGLQKVSATETSISVKWNASTNATGYILNYRVKGANSWIERSVNTTSYNITGLTAGTQYEIKVTAVNGSTSGTASDVLSVSTVNAPVTPSVPSKVSGLQKVSATETSISVKWNASTNATGYILNYRVKGASSWTERSVSTTSYNITGLTAGTQYEIKVTAVNGSTKGTASDVLAASTVSPPAVPSKVTGLKVTSATESTLYVTWNASTNATNYVLSYAVKGTNNWVEIPTTSTNHIITGLTAGTKYQLKAHAINAATPGAVSDTIEASTTAKLPEAEKVLTATQSGDTDIVLSWKAMTNAAYYDLQYYLYTSGWKTVPGGNNLTKLTFTYTHKKCSGLLFRVVGFTSTGEKVAMSAPALGTTKGLTVSQDNYQVTLKWDKAADAKSYTLRNYIPNLGPVPIDGFKEITSNTATIYLAPGDIHTLTLVSNTTSGSSKIIFNELSIAMPELNIADNTDKGMNAKLLYLERAINKTKYVQDDITVKYNSVSNYEIDYLKSTIFLPGLLGTYNGTAAVQKFFDTFNDDSSAPMMAQGTDTMEENISFRLGSGKNAKGKVVYLKYLLEPATNSDNYYLASIYDSQKPANWKNGFTKVDVEKNSDGSYDYTVTIKQETLKNGSNSLYHKGIFESVGAIISGVGSGASVNDATIGATTIKAKIGADGILQTYHVESPFDASLDMNFDGFIGSISMHIKGNGSASYVFTK